jgi:hypothetical protein
MALDREGSLADDDATISDADQEKLPPDMVVLEGHDAEEVAAPNHFYCATERITMIRSAQPSSSSRVQG